MSATMQLARAPRRPAPQIDKGEFPLQEPPTLPESVGGGGAGLNMLFYLPMMAGSAAMMLMFYSFSGMRSLNNPMMLIAGGIMLVAFLIMGVAWGVRSGMERKGRLKGERRDYLRYLGQVRRQVRSSLDKQRTSVLFTHPEPARLWAVVPTDRLWERRANHADFAEVRIGLGQQRLALELAAPQTKPVEDLEPLCASGLRRFLRAYTTIEEMPVAVYLRGFAKISLDGDPVTNRALVRAMLAQLATFHAPDDLRITVYAAADRLRHWDWVKWLPHAQHPDEADAVGSARMVCDTLSDLDRMLGGKALDERGRFEVGAAPTSTEPFLVVVLDDAPLPSTARLAGPGYRNVIAIDVDRSLPWDGAATTLRLRIRGEQVERVSLTRAGEEESVTIGRPDQLSLVRARALARLMAPYRLGAAARASDATAVTADLASLLGVAELRSMEPQALWQTRSPWEQLRVPIGVNERGRPVELDIKESAQGGMGPHGILIGATGSGKSELIRTIVLALAMTHSSEALNMVLVDFKGGATFLGLDGLPHVSALITNLADELPLVDRMQDALQGELVRRQELLRRHGFTSRHEYERSRATGAALAPLPTLVIIVDEFGELLASKSEFGELFMMIGRLGRSLGVHLLLASQRFEEGRIHTLETHLSYRIGLRMYSGMESRGVIGTTDCYDQPLTPGTGYLRTDTTTLVKFRGAYVSGPCPLPGRRRARPAGETRVLPFEAGYVVPFHRPDRDEEPTDGPAEPQDAPATETVLQVIVDRLRDAGPPAHRVWLPPLDDPATLDQLLPALTVDPARGFGAPYGNLRVPVGLVDRPYDQRRDPLIADLEGGKGHVAVVGAPRTGKSTLLRTLITALALTHTPVEVQFYILDFGGGGLASLADLPHVGSVAQRRDRERVTRTVVEVLGLLAAREAMFNQHGVESMAAYRRQRALGQVDDPYGDVFLVIDGWYTLRQEYEALEDSLQDIASRGLTYGVHLVVGAGRWSEIRPWLRDVLQTRLELRLGDPMESEIDFRKARDVPQIPGRGMTPSQYHYLTAIPRIDGLSTVEDLAEGQAALAAAVRDHWSGPVAPPVRLLPRQLDVDELPPPEGDLRVAFGVDDQTLQPVWHDFSVTPHLIAFGDHQSGKSNLLRLFLRAITTRFTPEEARVLVVDPRRRLQDLLPPAYQIGYVLSGEQLKETLAQVAPVLRERVPRPEITPDRLPSRDWWSGPRIFVLIDDHELVATGLINPAEALVGLLAQGTEIGLHVVVARSTSGGMRAMNDQVLRRMWDLGTPGLLFSCPRDEYAFLGGTKPLTLPPGRAQWISRFSGTALVQAGLMPPGPGAS
ncbi:type VII secretion protein EccCa [Dactylosporangium sucinum]|uniref:Type VII secretion protein EccC n=1 Tax=Dactylosporangium sucinum TaxID=1424081 RepID=A0A917SZV7_9ACTN|nr:type VII secretion protein EccCa [Dactylosporangium sucinum]GGM03885.1 type VII secretion protein EccC [Dactylosporangium sucinum]